MPCLLFLRARCQLPNAATLAGDFQKTRAALQASGIIDEHDHWGAGTTTVVQVGDQLDRGGEELAILLLLERLKHEAAAVGGALYTINGNHEIMGTQGDIRYVEMPAAGIDFDRWHYYYSFGQKLKRNCGLDAPPPPAPSLTPSGVIPPALTKRWQALQPGGPISSRFLATQNCVLLVGDTVFVHGGLLPEHVEYGVENVNLITEQWLLNKHDITDKETAARRKSLLRGKEAVVWSRHFSSTKNEPECELLDQVLSMLDASRMVVGHTIQKTGITSACSNKVHRVDVGLSKGCRDGPLEVLEITDDTSVKILNRVARESVTEGEDAKPSQDASSCSIL